MFVRKYLIEIYDHDMSKFKIFSYLLISMYTVTLQSIATGTFISWVGWNCFWHARYGTSVTSYFTLLLQLKCVLRHLLFQSASCNAFLHQNIG